MLTNILVEDANKIIANECINIQAIGLPILDSLDYVLAEDIESDINIPPFNRSPLDGYAYRSEDTYCLHIQLGYCQ